MSERKTLVIGCKLASGLLLELGNPQDREGYSSVKLNGANQGEYRGRNENGKIFHSTTEQGFGLTKVDSDFWGKWCNRYKTNSARWLKEGVLFVSDSGNETEVKAQAADLSDVRTGFEQLDPDKLPGGLKSAAAE